MTGPTFDAVATLGWVAASRLDADHPDVFKSKSRTNARNIAYGTALVLAMEANPNVDAIELSPAVWQGVDDYVDWLAIHGF